ncbi:MAG: hypothetical protein ACETVM_05020 [Candidatus Bathyarchaeia archaeon]
MLILVEVHTVKRVRLVLRDPDLNKMVGNELDLSLGDSANIVDVIRKVDEIVLEKGRFPIVGCESLLHLTFHPFEKRFYGHVALTAYSRSERFLNVRGNPKLTLPDETTVVLALTICSGEWEPIVNPE